MNRIQTVLLILCALLLAISFIHRAFQDAIIEGLEKQQKDVIDRQAALIQSYDIHTVEVVIKQDTDAPIYHTRYYFDGADEKVYLVICHKHWYSLYSQINLLSITHNKVKLRGTYGVHDFEKYFLVYSIEIKE